MAEPAERWKTPRDWKRTEKYYIHTLREQCYHYGANKDNKAVIAAKRLIPDDVKTILDVGSGSSDLGFMAQVDVGHGIDFHWLPYPDNSFDLVWARHAIEHSPMPTFALFEWKRVTRKYLLVIVPEVTPYMAEYWGHWTCLPDFGWRALFRKVGLSIQAETEGEWIHQHPHTNEPKILKESRFLCRK